MLIAMNAEEHGLNGAHINAVTSKRQVYRKIYILRFHEGSLCSRMYHDQLLRLTGCKADSNKSNVCRWETTVLLGNLRRAVQVLQGQSTHSRLSQKLLAWREWAGRRRQLARSVASRLQGRYLGGVWSTWREFVQYAKLSRSQGMAAIGHFTAKTTKQVQRSCFLL